MPLSHKHRPIIYLIFLLLLPGHGQPGFAQAEKTLSVFVSIMPEVYFVKRIGGDHVQVHALLQPGQNPATYAPTPQQMSLLAQAAIYFKIGVPFEKSLVPKIKKAVPDLIIKDLQSGINLIELSDHHHDDNDLDPHTWLDPLLVKQHALVIKESLVEFDPRRRAEYETNYKQFAGDLEALDHHLRETLLPFSGKTIYVFHPAYGYLCRAYNLKQKAVSINGKKPGAKHLVQLIQDARKDKVRVIFVQPQFSGKTARAIAQAIDATVIDLDPLAEDYLINMKHIAKEIIKSQTP